MKNSIALPLAAALLAGLVLPLKASMEDLQQVIIQKMLGGSAP